MGVEDIDLCLWWRPEDANPRDWRTSGRASCYTCVSDDCPGVTEPLRLRDYIAPTASTRVRFIVIPRGYDPVDYVPGNPTIQQRLCWP